MKLTVNKWSEYNAPRLSAALAYYALLSLAPVVVVLLAIYSVAFPRGAARLELLNQAQDVIGFAGVDAIKALTANLAHVKESIPAAILAGLILFLGASAVFSELRDSLNTIWDAPTVSNSLRDIILRRVLSGALVVGLGLLLLISLFLGMVLQMLKAAVVTVVPANTVILGELCNLLLSFLAMAAVFALIFKVVPDVPIGWRDVAIGAFATAFLFTAGRAMLALYLSKAAVGSAYGAAGSLVAFVVWVYYSAQIFLLGAIFTRVYAGHLGSHSKPRKPLILGRF